MNQIEICSIINRIDDLKTLPVVYIKLSNLLQNPNATATMIGNAIADDQAIAAKVLRLVNSAFYGFPRRISSLSEAVVILGLNEIRNLVLGTSVLDVFLKSNTKGSFDMHSLWEHSIACAVGSKIIAETVSAKDPEVAFLGGLFHDIGKLVHAIYLKDEFGSVIECVEKTGMPMREAEEQILDFDHAHTGTVLGQKWQLPDKLLDAIGGHHFSDTNGQLRKETAIVHLANILSIALRLGSGGDIKVPVINNTAWKILELKLSNLEPIMEKLREDFDESVAILAA